MNGFMDELVFWANVANVPFSIFLGYFAYRGIVLTWQMVNGKEKASTSFIVDKAIPFALVVIIMLVMSVWSAGTFLQEQLL